MTHLLLRLLGPRFSPPAPRPRPVSMNDLVLALGGEGL